MVILFKKALRGIWSGKRAFGACILLITLGVSSYTGFTLTSRQLLLDLENMYAATGFGQVFATVQGIPASGLNALTRLEGVRAATAVMTVDTRVDHDGDAVLTLRVLSASPGETGELILTSGEAPVQGEIAVSEAFYAAQGLQPGDTVALVANGRQIRPKVSGTVMGAAYISGVGEGLSGDVSASGYACMPQAQVEALAENGGLYNSISFLLEDGAVFEDLRPALEDALNRYGLKSLYGREDHIGHRLTYENFFSLSGTASMISFIFLAIAIPVLYILLRRVIEQERSQIGTLKAFGVPPARIVVMYMGYGGVIGLAGGVLGTACGLAIARIFTGMYLIFFPMTALPLTPDPGVLGTGVAISVMVGLAGAVMGARSVLRLSPAESMRAPAPPAYRGGADLRKNPLLRAVLSSTGFMALRSISRSRSRSIFVAAGMAVSFAILTFMSSYASLIDDIVMDQFNEVQLYDIKLSLEQPAGYAKATGAAAGLQGVTRAEGVLELAATVGNAHLYTDATLTGLGADAATLRIYDSIRGTSLAVPEHGAIISRALADKLGAGEGDSLWLTTDYTGDEKLAVRVGAIVNENLGMTAYMELGALCALLNAPRSVNSLLLVAEDTTAVKEKLADTQAVSLSDQSELMQATQNNLDATLGVNVGLFCIIGFGIAFAIITSTASISLSERSREYATLRVLGMHPREIGQILSFEYWLLTLAGFLPGIPLAVGLRVLIASSISTDSLSISPGVDPAHYLVGGAICLLTVFAANNLSVRRIAKFDMPEVLKERE